MPPIPIAVALYCSVRTTPKKNSVTSPVPPRSFSRSETVAPPGDGRPIENTRPPETGWLSAEITDRSRCRCPSAGRA